MNRRGLTPEDIFAGRAWPNSPEDEPTVEPCEATWLGNITCELPAGHKQPHEADHDGKYITWWDRIDLPSRHRRAA